MSVSSVVSAERKEQLVVDVLRCPSCGAPVPLADSDEVPCAHCPASVPVPEAHRALVRADNEYIAGRATAERLIRRFGKPPSLAVRFAGSIDNGVAFIFVSVFAIFFSQGVTYGLYLSAYVVARRVFRVDLDDTFFYLFDGTALFTMASYGMLTSTAVALSMLAAYARRSAESLRFLHAGLAAKSPSRAGGPAECRTCGAPLFARSGDLSVNCPYCRTDNLVRIPDEWVARARDKARRLAASIEDATQAFLVEQKERRTSLLTRLLVAAVPGIMLVTFVASASDGAKVDTLSESPYRLRRPKLYSTFDWQESVDKPSLYPDAAEALIAGNIRYWRTLVPDACPNPPKLLLSPSAACGDSGCTLHYYVALRSRDEIELSGLPVQGQVWLDEHTRGKQFHTSGASWGTTIDGPHPLGPGHVTRLTAPHDGWFRLVLTSPHFTPDGLYELCSRLVRSE